MTNIDNLIPPDAGTRKAVLNERLERFGWAALLITTGTIWLLPDKQVPQGSWLIAAGIILLGLNAIRYLNGIPLRIFSLVAGAVALLAGVRAYLNWDMPLLPIVLIAIGICMLLMPLFEKPALCSSAQGCCFVRRTKHERNQEPTMIRR